MSAERRCSVVEVGTPDRSRSAYLWMVNGAALECGPVVAVVVNLVPTLERR